MVFTTRKPKLGPPLVVKHDDVCLGLVGKAGTWWPLRVHGSGDDDPTVDVIFFGDSKTGRLARNKLRPFSDLREIPSRFIPKRCVRHASRQPCPRMACMYATRAAKREPCPTYARPTTHRSITYQNAIKEANEWVETAKSSDEPTSHDLPRLEFVSEARAASDSKQLGVGHAARLASLPQPSFRLARCAKDPTEAESPAPDGHRPDGNGSRQRPRVEAPALCGGPPDSCVFAGSSRKRSPLRPQSPSAVSLRLREFASSLKSSDPRCWHGL